MGGALQGYLASDGYSSWARSNPEPINTNKWFDREN
jgi:hypothetical protein